MSISGVNGARRVSLQTAETPVPTSNPPAPAQANALAPEIDVATNLPLPPRFPWLSRLSAELEPSAKQKPTFPTSPPLGENLDQAA